METGVSPAYSQQDISPSLLSYCWGTATPDSSLLERNGRLAWFSNFLFAHVTLYAINYLQITLDRLCFIKNQFIQGNAYGSK